VALWPGTVWAFQEAQHALAGVVDHVVSRRVCRARNIARFASLCRRFGVSRKTGYKSLALHRQGLPLDDRPRRPRRSPAMTPESIVQRVLDARDRHPAWGARKLAAWLAQRGLDGTPSPSTINRILHRYDLIDASASRAATAFARFERARANELWQMDL